MVERRDLTQWFFKITDYAQRLLDDMVTLEAWPERVLTMQRNWIGRSEGARVTFAIEETGDAVWKVWMRALQRRVRLAALRQRVDRGLDRLALGAKRRQQLVLARLIGRPWALSWPVAATHCVQDAAIRSRSTTATTGRRKLLRLRGDRGGQSERGQCRAEEKSVH